MVMIGFVGIATFDKPGTGATSILQSVSWRTSFNAPAWCENSRGGGSIFMASGWPGKGHGALLKNSLYARFGPRMGLKHTVIGAFRSFWSPMRSHFQLSADFFNSAPWPYPKHENIRPILFCCRATLKG